MSGMREGSLPAPAPEAARAERREPLLLGMVAFLASELMFFGGLFAAYFTLRSRTEVWPPSGVELEVLEPALATGALVLSSFTMQAAARRMREGDPAGMRCWVGLTLVLGGAFLASQAHGWAVANFGISTGAYGTMFYAMTGFHGLHVLAGLVLMVVVLGRAAGVRNAGRGRTEPAGVEAVTYYWHFVDVVWLGLFGTIYLLR